MTGAILAGGKSSRMGRDKALLEWGGQTLLERAVKIITPWVMNLYVVTNNPKDHQVVGAEVILDRDPFQGPLAALEIAFSRVKEGSIVVLACDLPGATSELIGRLVEMASLHPGKAIVTKDHAGSQPLCAVYPVTAANEMRRILSEGRRSMQELINALQPNVEWYSVDELKNMNTPEDYERITAHGERPTGITIMSNVPVGPVEP